MLDTYCKNPKNMLVLRLYLVIYISTWNSERRVHYYGVPPTRYRQAFGINLGFIFSYLFYFISSREADFQLYHTSSAYNWKSFRSNLSEKSVLSKQNQFLTLKLLLVSLLYLVWKCKITSRGNTGILWPFQVSRSKSYLESIMWYT